MEKNLQDLLKLLPEAEVTGAAGKTITDITADSRVVVPGSLFICLKGATVDGHKFLQQAHEKALWQPLLKMLLPCPEGMTLIKVNDTRRAMELVTPYFFDYPGKKMRMIGVTGTNGKTTTTNIIRLILRRAGYKVGMIGTINIMIEDEETVSHNTTPDVVDLQKTLYKMQQCGCDYVVMEVSSHALALKRVAGIEYDTAVLTNITQDHLDFHKTFENYRDAKSLLFEHLAGGTKEGKTAVLNMDDPSSKIIAARTKVPVITYGESKDYDIYPISFDVQAKQMALKLHTPACEMDLVLKITGEFNVYNVMAAVCAALAEGLSREEVIQGLDQFGGVPGRFQLIDAGQDATVVVDYAHTPDGLENVLHTARQITQGKLWVVFGCGGDRDAKKRPIMGKLALDLADQIVVTTDNPRSEDPEAIIRDIEAGMQGAAPGKEIHKITDRKDAIEFAVGTPKKATWCSLPAKAMRITRF